MIETSFCWISSATGNKNSARGTLIAASDSTLRCFSNAIFQQKEKSNGEKESLAYIINLPAAITETRNWRITDAERNVINNCRVTSGNNKSRNKNN